MAANDHEIGRLQAAAKQSYIDGGSRLNDLLLATDRDEAVRFAERGHAARAFAHRPGDQAAFLVFDQADKQILGATNLAVHLDGQLGGKWIAVMGRQTRQAANYRRDELVKGKDCGRWKPGENDDWFTLGHREANRLTWLERDAVSDDAGILEFADDSIRQIAGAFACAAGEEHHVAVGNRLLELRPQLARLITH